jgi:hypothetical protein
MKILNRMPIIEGTWVIYHGVCSRTRTGVGAGVEDQGVAESGSGASHRCNAQGDRAIYFRVFTSTVVNFGSHALL